MSQSRSQRFPVIPLFAAIGALSFGSFTWFAIANSAQGRMTHVRVLSALAILLIAFLPLARLAAWRRWAPVRIALGVAVIFSILDAMSLPAPPRPESVSSFVAFFLILVLAVTAHLLAEVRPRLAFAALAGLAMCGAYFDYAIDYYTTSIHFAPAVKYNAWPLAVIAAACLAACWHGRSLLQRPAGRDLAVLP